ncbi:CDP-alcohol phosphatidyltransferase family protein [Alkaliphilus pronyensis]|uniref:CDP-alcohol phosphatidyltransferase family protein n=1 Tax=Alkaliphilus pronyensis TaxID=1482732 RepID=A0A6I0F947_9FIRM|nr:CDP-alcohol phosphatidyltransferase family protein [Alkaliphilus pronyensis]KAB3535314.1 CDP-alcohol phosphatidyltransferase family protein [Alkaliphilus pronyensis]
MLDTRARSYIQPLFDKVADLCIKYKLSANHVTVIALIIGLVPSIVLYLDFSNILAVSILWLSGCLDAVDGTIARKTKASSPFGTIMDITFDRIVEISLMLVLALKFSSNPFVFVVLAATIIINMTIFLTVGAASDKVSQKSFYYQPGLTERTEGFIMFSLMILLPNYTDYIALIFAAMIIFTSGQRFMEAHRFFKDK